MGMFFCLAKPLSGEDRSNLKSVLHNGMTQVKTADAALLLCESKTQPGIRSRKNRMKSQSLRKIEEEEW